MADISRELQAILQAVYGEEVRGSIHDAIDKINLVCDSTLSAGTDVTSPTSSIEGYYEDSVYVNTDTDDLWVCDGEKWVRKGSLEGNSIVDIRKTNTQDLVDEYTITFNKIDSIKFYVTNGYTPTVDANKAGKVTTINITNKSGSTSEQILDGFDPTVEVSKSGTIATITITDINGPHTFQIKDGETGPGTGDMLKSIYDQNDDGIIDEIALPLATVNQIRAAIDAVR